MPKQSVEIINKSGLHVHTSSRFTQTMSQFKYEVQAIRDGSRVSGKNIMGLMMFTTAKGTVIELETDGADEATIVQTLADLTNGYFGEGE